MPRYNPNGPICQDDYEYELKIGQYALPLWYVYREGGAYVTEIHAAKREQAITEAALWAGVDRSSLYAVLVELGKA